MKPETIFKLKTFLLAQLVEPWTDSFSLPNARTIFLILGAIALLLKNKTLCIISAIGFLIFYEIDYYKSGKYIAWYRQRKMSSWNEAKKKIKQEKKDKLNGIEIPTLEKVQQDL
ncbi:MAG: hypothetical protein WC758_07675 [Candidatus Woesearchaeota archaeon]|jgi:hypothetical protein